MNKNSLSERDICTKFINPALEAAGWDIATQVREEFPLTKGRIIVRGKLHTRAQHKRADYVLFYKPNLPIAVIEAKGANHSVGDGMQQGLRYAEMLQVPFVFSSNGNGFLFHNKIAADGILEREIGLHEFPAAETLWRCWATHQGLNNAQNDLVTQDYYSDGSTKMPRYYQLLAINKTIEAIALGQNRILLVMATGTGKTYTAFQIIWRLWKAKSKKRILFLADRNILVDQTMTNDFKPFGSAMTKIQKRQANKSYEIYLSLYQAVTGAEEERNIYKQFSRDFFDLIVIDECHRGSAAADSAWREILEYFSAATQIGLTATPRETKEVSNIDYFGEPIYTYSLRQGIDDGFLAPYKVVRIDLDKDLAGWRPDKGMVDKYGNEIEDRIYNQKDFDKTLVLEKRTEVVAKKISEFLKQTNRFDKTIVFCDNIDHAERMRQALVNENGDLVAQNSKYVMRITGDNEEGKAELDNFIFPESRYPVIATTSKLMSNEKAELGFEYAVNYEIDGKETEVIWKAGKFSIDGRARATIGKTPLPDNVLIYYSGHNDTVAELVQRYEAGFRKRIKGANPGESRRFIGIGAEYKQLLLAVLVMQPVHSKARQFICQKLGVTSVGTDMQLALLRPSFATGALKALEVDSIENFDPRTHYWGADGITRDFLEKLVTCVKGEFNHGNVYNAADDRYLLPINIELFRQRFAADSVTDIFRQFDNLKTLGMLADMSIPLKLDSGLDATIAHFSDGQFQSVYIYSIVELLKDRNCLTLLDEPDCFLHPEWQFDFLKQVFEITDAAGKKCHVLMSSHSAVTLIPHDKKKIKFFDIKDSQANCYELPKSVAIKKLSADLIRYSEQDTLLSILNTVQIERKPVLFTEGSTDPIILKEAWSKLYDVEMPFIPFYAFSCTFINQLLTDCRIHNEMGGLPIFALFDFDKAYDQWNGLNGAVIEADPSKGMVKRWATGESYAIMLPVPDHADIRRQVIRNPATNETYGGESVCEIEHLFYGQAAAANYYQHEPCVGGSKIVFKSDSEKTAFAKEVVPTLDAACFKVFQPMFDFIKAKCVAGGAS